MKQIRYMRTLIEIFTGDLTATNAEAIVNPANTFGTMGGGVALAIRNRGGMEIEKEAKSKAPIALGEAIATTAGRLKAKYVIHAPTMLAPAEKACLKNIEKAVLAVLKLASELEVKSIAFPGMGTGTGCLIFEEAATEMAAAIKEFLKKDESTTIERILLVGFDMDQANDFEVAVEKVFM